MYKGAGYGEAPAGTFFSPITLEVWTAEDIWKEENEPADSVQSCLGGHFLSQCGLLISIHSSVDEAEPSIPVPAREYLV